MNQKRIDILKEYKAHYKNEYKKAIHAVPINITKASRMLDRYKQVEKQLKEELKC